MAENKRQRSEFASQAWRVEFDRVCEEGRFGEAAALFDRFATAAEPAEVLLAAARAHMHARPAEALGILLRIPDGALAERVSRDALLAEAFARTADFDSADARLESALAGARATGDCDLVATVGYRLVRRYLHAEEPAAARRALVIAREGRSDDSRAYALYAETLVLPFEERIAEQANRLIEFLRLTDPTTAHLVDLRAWATHSLAGLARELYIPHAIPEIERQLNGGEWPNDFAQNRFQALKALGWAKALQGDYFNAFRHLKSASHVALVSAAWQVVAACDRAYLARCFGEHRWSRVELHEAEELAANVDWQATLGEERIGLLLLAELFGTIDTARSATYLARYRALGEMRSPLHYKHDARLTAFAQFSTGIVELALGSRRRGLAELRAARRVFDRFGCDFRSARCLAAEFGVTGERDVLPLIEEKLRNYEQSWLAAELRAANRSNDASMPPMRRRVFDEVCRGKSTAEIATSLERSKFTVSNHIKELFKTFGVKNRSALVAEAVRRGITGPS